MLLELLCSTMGCRSPFLAYFQVREARVYVFLSIWFIFGLFLCCWCLNDVTGRMKMFGVWVCLVERGVAGANR